MSSTLKLSSAKESNVPKLRIGLVPLRIRDILALARGRSEACLEKSPEYRARLDAGHDAISKGVVQGDSIYGVNTGVGASVENEIPEALYEQLPLNLLRFHGCGTGRILDEEEAGAVVAVRLATLSRGFSGVRALVLERLCSFLNLRLFPQIPAEGSVGASGDLTPLSYIAATLVGEREVSLNGRVLPAKEALAEVGLEPITLNPKESLALMNGTSMMSGMGCLAFERAERLARFAAGLTAVATDVMNGNPEHFDERIFDLKPHPGQMTVAGWIREDLEGMADRTPGRLQDRYSLRCAPHVIGVLVDALRFTQGILQTEINSVNDNPIIIPETGEALHGGNFYGGHLCFAFDGLKTAVANIADLLDRQLVLLCNPAESGGLPENLVGVSGPESVVHHGFKAMQITASALTAEALKLTGPASVFSRSTESHNQDKVSMGPIAVRDCLRILDLCETVSVIHALAVCQAVDLRKGAASGTRSVALHEAVRKTVSVGREDRRQDRDIEAILERYRAGDLPIGALGDR